MYPYEGVIKYNIEGQDMDFTFSTEGTSVNEHLEIYAQLISKGNASVFELRIKPKREIKIMNLLAKVKTSLRKTDRVFINGFQTWTESREYGIDEKIPKLNRLAWNILSPYGDYTFSPHSNEKGVYHSFTYSYINRDNQSYTLYGSLCEAYGYTIFKYNTVMNEMHIVKECSGLSIRDEYNAFEIFICSGNESYVFEEYFNAMNIKKPSVKPCTGWTSWYNYYTGITEEIIMENLNAFSSRNIPIDTFQIDDGYQNAVGDWLVVNNKFPKGMKYISDNIKDRGYKAGLWLAPFICEKRSIIYKEHPGWLLRDDRGKPVNAGYNPGWSGIFYALDIYNQEVRDYLVRVFNDVLTLWGFDMVKLDFLYAAALLPRKDKTRGQIMHEAMEFLREIIGDKIILGCGVPLGPSFGKVDYCRIGSDVALKWEDRLLGGLKYRERVSTINSLTSTIGRRHLNGKAFYNDPDVFILRERNNKLAREQKNTLFILNLIFGGLVFTSDNINDYSEEEMQKYLSLFPIREKSLGRIEYTKEQCAIEFTIDDRSYFAVSNLSGKEARFPLKEGVYFERTLGFITGSTDGCLKPYETICFLKLGDRDFEIAGSDNIFPGNEIEGFSVENDNIILEYHKQSMNVGNIFIKVPEGVVSYKVNGETFMVEKVCGINLLKVASMD